MNRKSNKRFCVDLPQKMHNQIWRLSGKMKINIVVQCLLVEYMTDADLQEKIRTRMTSRQK